MEKDLAVRTKRWREMHPERKVPRFKNSRAILRALELRRKLLAQPIDLVKWDKNGNMVPAPVGMCNPQIGAIICRWAIKIQRDPPYPKSMMRCSRKERPKCAARSGAMREYDPVMTDYVETGGVPVELIPEYIDKRPKNLLNPFVDDEEDDEYEDEYGQRIQRPTYFNPNPFQPRYIPWHPPPDAPRRVHTGIYEAHSMTHRHQE